MKHCPSCKTNYADDTLQFCLQDGTQLNAIADPSMPTVAFNDAEAETVVRSPQTNKMRFDTQNAQPPNWQQNPPAQFQPQKKSNTALAVLLTAFVMLVLFGLGFGAWLFLGSRKNPGNVGTRDFPTPTATISNSNTNTKPSPSPSVSTTITPTVNPTPPEIDTEEIKSEVSDALDDWKDSMESGSLDSVMSHYAGNLDYYYKSRGVSSSSVRSNKRKAFDIYYKFRVGISNMSITPDASGQKATAVFNKSWTFEGSGERSTGTVRAQFQLTKIAGKWYITGEKDL